MLLTPESGYNDDEKQRAPIEKIYNTIREGKLWTDSLHNEGDTEKLDQEEKPPEYEQALVLGHKEETELNRMTYVDD